MDDNFDDIVLDDYTFGDVEEPTTTTQARPSADNNSTPRPEAPPKPVIKKLNEDLLMDTNGIPLLRNETRYLKFREGREHTDQNLQKLMGYYSTWSNNLSHKLKFPDFIRRVGPPASGKHVKVMLNEWQDEYREKLQVQLDVQNELSGRTVGDEDGDNSEQNAESSDDDNRPLFFPITETATAVIEKAKAAKKPTKPTKPKKQYRSSDIINSENEVSEDDEDLPATKKQRTITFSDSEEEQYQPVQKASAASGRERALAILAEKRRQKELAQQKEKQRTVEEETVDAPVQKKTVDEMIDEYYDDDIQLDLDDADLEALNIDKSLIRKPATAKQTYTTTSTSTTAENDDEQFSDNELIDTTAIGTTTTSKALEEDDDFGLYDDHIQMEDTGLTAEELSKIGEATKEKNNDVISTNNNNTTEDSEMHDI